MLEVCLSGPGETERWDPVQSYASPRESLIACSECVEEIQLMLGIDPIPGPEQSVARLRVWDLVCQRPILWEDAQGAIHCDSSAFPDGFPAEPETRVGITINDSIRSWSDWILDGIKSIETRDDSSLRPYVGQRVGIVRVRKGPATLLGYVTITAEKQYRTGEEFARDFDQHRIPDGLPGFGFRGECFGYVLADPRRTPPQRILSRGNVVRRLAPPCETP